MATHSQNSASGTVPSMGIDLGSRMLKLLVADKVNERIDIQAAAALVLEEGIVTGGIVEEPRKLARAMSHKLQELRIEDVNAVISIPSNLAVLRWVTLPKLEGADLRDAARYKVRRHLPFPVENAYIEVSQTELDSPDSEMAQSLVIAVKRDIIDSRAEAIEIAGVNLVGAELEAQAILRIVERRLSQQSVLWRDASLTIIDVGGTSTHMYVVQNQRLQFIRGVRFGSDGFASAVATEFNCTPKEADQIINQQDTELRSDGILHLRLGDLPAMVNVQPEVEKLTREFLRLLRYFRSLHPERSYAGILDHVLVCGGLVGIKGFTEYLQGVLGLRVERMRPFAGMVAKFNQETFESVANRQEAYTVVMGLALSGLQDRETNTGDTRARREFTWARSA